MICIRNINIIVVAISNTCIQQARERERGRIKAIPSCNQICTCTCIYINGKQELNASFSSTNILKHIIYM